MSPPVTRSNSSSSHSWQSSDSLSICVFNVRSLVNKLYNFQSFVYASNFNASNFNEFCLTETWLSENIYDCEILSSDFVIYRKDRSSWGGGVLVAVHRSIYSCLLSSLSHLEILSVRLSLDQELILCSIYVPPNSSEMYLWSLLSYLADLVTSFKQCIFVGALLK